MLASRLRGYFSFDVCRRGDEYDRAGRVEIVSASKNANYFLAKVVGTKIYLVELSISGPKRRTVKASCSCPYVTSHDDFCKHIWATLKRIDREYDPPLSRAQVLMLLEGSIDDEDVRAFMEDDDELDLAAPVESGLRSSARAKRAPVYDRPVQGWHGAGHKGPPRRLPGTTEKPRPHWSTLFETLTRAASAPGRTGPPVELPNYVLEPRLIMGERMVHVRLTRCPVLKSGRLGQHRDYMLTSEAIPHLPLLDRQICLTLIGAAGTDETHGYVVYSRGLPAGACPLPVHIRPTLLPTMAQTGRLYYSDPKKPDPTPVLLQMDEAPWELVLTFERAPTGDKYLMQPRLQRGDAVEPVRADLVIKGEPTYLVCGDVLRRVDTPSADLWLQVMPVEPLTVPGSQRRQLISKLASAPGGPRIEWPEEWRIEMRHDMAPQPELALTISPGSGPQDPVAAVVKFHYGSAEVDVSNPARYLPDASGNGLIARQRDQESNHLARLRSFEPRRLLHPGSMEFLTHQIPEMARTLLHEGWRVTGNGKPYRKSGHFEIEVTTGIDWFDLQGAVDFDGFSVEIHELLSALRTGERFVRLGDGSVGLLPEEWLKLHGASLSLGRVQDGRVRFAKAQIGLIDAMLERMPEATFDAALATARQKLQQFERITPAAEPPGFQGRLRDYQREGLGWELFLDEFGWGGCLADDMGLGKTVQVLALQVAVRQARQTQHPALLVVPKSTVSNWLREAQRFAPTLRAVDYTGLQRRELRPQLATHDLVITTYGTLRRDIEFLAQCTFDYVVLDEAQAIKNPKSQNAKAARLLQASHRLALTGTPVENHINDLWSLFEFIAPGLLGGSDAFRRTFGLPAAQQAEGGSDLELLRRLIRPFVLRRTKSQVAPELPERMEQIVECELPPRQRAFYDKLRDHFRSGLLKRVAEKGLARSKIHILEALLRLRQAACHPALVDATQRSAEAAKLDTLVTMLRELIDEGHKALVFSQFTQLLALVRSRLHSARIGYEYLDGRTRQRQDRIDHFQQDPACPVFLISLKAGGTGLNLTAADYVFILDPWWNPAVEAQAIDRTHRIGQTRKVNAYRLIARDTVEARILELQASKRALADAIITTENSLIRSLTRDDLAQLLS